MSSRRGRYSHGRDKDEWFLRRYNAGWQAWWLVVILVLAMAASAVGAALGVAVTTHHTNGADTRRSYTQGYIDGQDSVSTTTTRPEPSASPVSPTAVPFTG